MRQLCLTFFTLCLVVFCIGAETELQTQISSFKESSSLDEIEKEIFANYKCQRGEQAYLSEENTEQACFVFLSFSVPEATWIVLNQEVKKINGSIRVKGAPQNSLKELAKQIKHLRSVGVDSPIIIDPEAFSRFNITAVPAFVVIDHEKFDVILGNIPLVEVLRVLKERGETTKQSKTLFKQLTKPLHAMEK